MQRFQATATQPSRYGVHWTYQDIAYPGKLYPATETAYSFTQSGRGSNGGFFHNNAYEWTPAIVNAVFFGVAIASYPPIGKGSVQACYDLVDITINYTVPPSTPSKSSVATEIISLKQPSVYPNPFTSKTNLQFTAIENGNVIVELYNITGAKVRTLFSGKVRKGQTYNVTAGDAQLPKGTYMYKINNGKQIQMGRMLKYE